MRILIFTLVLAAALGPLHAQINSGTIDYNESYSFEWSDWMSKERKEEMKKRQDNGDFDQTGRLTFNDDAFSYTRVVDETKSTGRSWWSGGNGEPDVFYTSVTDSMVTDRRNVMDQAFIMEDAWVAPKWNIANMKIGMKEIPLPTQLATAVSIEGDTLTAYFTPSIPYGIGPRGYGGLPGAIVYLKVVKDGSATEYKMTTMQPNIEVAIEKPADEKVITRKEYEKQEQRAKEMRERRMRSWQRN
jgi:GLPGLI family protein